MIKDTIFVKTLSSSVGFKRILEVHLWTFGFSCILNIQTWNALKLIAATLVIIPWFVYGFCYISFLLAPNGNEIYLAPLLLSRKTWRSAIKPIDYTSAAVGRVPRRYELKRIYSISFVVEGDLLSFILKIPSLYFVIEIFVLLKPLSLFAICKPVTEGDEVPAIPCRCLFVGRVGVLHGLLGCSHRGWPRCGPGRCQAARIYLRGQGEIVV